MNKDIKKIRDNIDSLDSKILELLNERAQEAVNISKEKQKTKDLDNLIAETCAYLSQNHPDYGILAARIIISKLHKNTSESY